MAQFENIDFPGWEVIRKIGEGSFGGVYEIHRTLPGGRVEKCALKKLAVPRNDGEIQELISQSFSTESITAHYKNQMGELVNEYSLTQELSSCKNVVGCYDVRFIQHDDGIGWDIYIRMELLNPLRQALSAEYQEATVLRLGLDMCNALLACQEHSIIHRDIKPENILVSDRGEFKLGDFGIAKVSEKTATGTMTGTMGYMAPEVANRQHYGPQADIYSLGMVLYWMMNRRTLPFLPLPPSIPTGAQRQQAQDRRLSGEPLPPPIDGSEALRKIVLKACAFSPAERYRSAEEMQAALQSCMSTPAAPRMQRQKPMAPPAPILEPTVIDTPTELEREPAVHANAPRQAQQIPEQQGRQQMAEKQTPEKEAPKKDAPPKKQKKPVIYHVMVSLIAVALILACCGIGVVIFSYAERRAEAAKTEQAYQAALVLMEEGNYSDAADAFAALGDYNDSAEKAEEARGLQERKESIRVLREDIAWAEYLGDDNWNYPPVLGSSVTRDEVTAIVFRDTTKDAPKDAWDVSKNGDRSVLAWTSGPRGYYTLVIAAKGGVSAPENCYLLFADYPNVTSIQFNGAFDTSKVTDMGCMFSGCENLSSLNLSGFDTSKVTNMGCMFSGCESLTSLDVSSFNTSKAENMFSMFDGCEKLASLDVRGFDTSKVTNMCSMFSGCEKLASLNLSSFDTSNVEYMNCMFFYCKKLASLDMSSFDTSNVTDMALMFTGCENLFSLNLSSFDTSKVTGMSSMFSGCEKLTSLNLNGFDTSKVTDMSEMFSGCKKLASLNVNSFDTSKVENMRSMFNGCEKLTSLNLSGFKTSNVTDMHGMFSGCENLASLNVNSFDTSKVTDMSWMFNSCEKLASLDLSSFKTSKVTRMTFMFDGCDSLRYLNLGWFDTSSVTDYDYFMGDNITYNGRPWLELFE